MAHPTPKGRILCTEDDADTRDLFALVLEIQGYEVICTKYAKEALTRARDGHFDLFLFDNWLPEMSGIELTTKVRSFNLTTPILFVSGAGFKTDEAQAREAGAQGYLIKPIDTDELAAEVERLIAQYRPITSAAP